MVCDTTDIDGNCMQGLMHQMEEYDIQTFSEVNGKKDPGFRLHSRKSKIKETTQVMHDGGTREFTLEQITEGVNNNFGINLPKDAIKKEITGSSKTSKKEHYLSKDLVDGCFLKYNEESRKYSLHPNAGHHFNIPDGSTETERKRIDFSKNVIKLLKKKLEKRDMKIKRNKKIVNNWLEENGFIDYIEKFENCKKIDTADLQDLCYINEEDLKEVDMHDNKIRKFLDKIQKLKEEMRVYNN